MKVLQVNKYNFIKGGADRYFLDLAAALAKRPGVEVAKFAMRHPDNLPDRYERWFASQVHYGSRRPLVRLRAALRVLWSYEAAYKFGRLLDEFQPDVVHIHNIYHQLSPSILPVAKKRGLPIVMHIHDYKLICPNYKMYSHGRIDESTKGGRYWRCLANRCLKDSWSMSLLATVEMYLHHRLLKVYEKNIDCYIAPSAFVKRKLIEWGVAADKIQVVPHAVNTAKYKPVYQPGQYLLYFGRLEPEKGVATLLKAAAQLKGAWRLKIVGSGPEYKQLSKLALSLGIAAKVDFTGPKHGRELDELIAGAYLVVVPSEWYEIFGLVNLEAAALGKLVVAADIGGIAEVVKDGHSGLLFKPGSVNDLATKLDWCLANPKMVAEFGHEARVWVEQHFSPKEHLSAILKIYRSLGVR